MLSLGTYHDYWAIKQRMFIYSFQKSLFRSQAFFINSVICFLDSHFWTLCRFWILILCQIYSWHRFSLIVCLSSSLVWFLFVSFFFAVQNLFSFVKFHMSVVDLNSWAKSLPTPIPWRVLPMGCFFFFSDSLSVSCLGLWSTGSFHAGQQIQV